MSHTISIPFVNDPPFFNLTLIPVEHCIGAVMFLIEGTLGTVLITGDFRFSTDWKKSQYFGIVQSKQIDTLFLDTTFSSPYWSPFPSKKESIKQILELIEKKIKSIDEKSWMVEWDIFIEADMLGLEDILISISHHFRTKISVSKKAFERYEHLSIGNNFLTIDFESTRFHAGKSSYLKSLNKILEKNRIFKEEINLYHTDKRRCIYDPIFIRPSTQWFGLAGNKDLDRAHEIEHKYNGFQIKNYFQRPAYHNKIWHVLYSVHSSYDELVEFLSFIRPKSLIPSTICSPSFINCVSPFLSNDSHPLKILSSNEREINNQKYDELCLNEIELSIERDCRRRKFCEILLILVGNEKDT